MLIHCALHFQPNSGALRVEWQNSNPQFASTPEQGHKNFKYVLEWESNSQPVAFTDTRLCLCATIGLEIHTKNRLIISFLA